MSTRPVDPPAAPSSLAALARAHGLKPDTLRKRLLKMPLAEALAQGCVASKAAGRSQEARLVLTLGDRTETVDAWSRELGLPATLIRQRKLAGHPDAVCLQTTHLRSPAQDMRHEAPPPQNACRYCGRHQRAWYPGLAETPKWISLPRQRLRYAQALAVAAGCATQIAVQDTRCDRCTKEPPPMTQTSCDKCGVTARLESHADGLLITCASCRPSTTPCTEAHHWRGSTTAGVWVCWTCGSRLSSSVIDPDKVVKAPDADVAPNY